MLDELPPRERMAIAELMHGTLQRHSLYIVNPEYSEDDDDGTPHGGEGGGDCGVIACGDSKRNKKKERDVSKNKKRNKKKARAKAEALHRKPKVAAS